MPLAAESPSPAVAREGDTPVPFPPLRLGCRAAHGGQECPPLRPALRLQADEQLPAYEPLRSFNVGMREMKNAPAYVNGRLFFRNEKGQLACWQICE